MKRDIKNNYDDLNLDDENIKNHTILYIFLVLIVIICILLLYSRYFATSILTVHENPIYTDKIFDEADGLKIVQFSDLLYGSTISNRGLEKVVNKINSLKPDIVVFTGDLISRDYDINNKTIEYITKELNKINAKYGKFSIRGDNDYKNDTFIEIMEKSNFKHLDNNYDLVYISNNKYIFIGGINSSIESEINYNILKSFENNDIYKILLMHEPNNIDDVLSNIDIDLALSGHSLHGQLQLPFIGGIYYDKYSNKYKKEYYKINNTQFYISSGIGTDKYPFRFINNPTINLYRIIK